MEHNEADPGKGIGLFCGRVRGSHTVRAASLSPLGARPTNGGDMALQLAKMCTKKGEKRVYIPVELFDIANCSQLSGLFADALSNQQIDIHLV